MLIVNFVVVLRLSSKMSSRMRRTYCTRRPWLSREFIQTITAARLLARARRRARRAPPRAGIRIIAAFPAGAPSVPAAAHAALSPGFVEAHNEQNRLLQELHDAAVPIGNSEFEVIEVLDDVVTVPESHENDPPINAADHDTLEGASIAGVLQPSAMISWENRQGSRITQLQRADRSFELENRRQFIFQTINPHMSRAVRAELMPTSRHGFFNPADVIGRQIQMPIQFFPVGAAHRTIIMGQIGVQTEIYDSEGDAPALEAPRPVKQIKYLEPDTPLERSASIHDLRPGFGLKKETPENVKTILKKGFPCVYCKGALFEPIIMEPCGHRACTNCFGKIWEREHRIQDNCCECEALFFNVRKDELIIPKIEAFLQKPLCKRICVNFRAHLSCLAKTPSLPDLSKVLKTC